MGGDGDNVEYAVLSVVFRFGSIRGYIGNGGIGSGCAKQPLLELGEVRDEQTEHRIKYLGEVLRYIGQRPI